jgi:predicted DNA repair protein MutK
MSAGLFGLLDDVAALARLAAASGRASAKAAGVVIDDTAVTPQYVLGITAERELPIIKRIAIGSLRNKLLVILPVAMLLSQFAPRLVIPMLMLGAIYLCYEGAEKIWGSIRSFQGHDADAGPVAEDEVVTGAIRMDLVLSAEIMVIALNEVADQAFLPRLVILIVVALVLTAGVYGVVAVIVKMDDVGLRLKQTASRIGQQVGRGLVAAMPALLSVLSNVGVLAMLWVGGHILLAGSDHLGWHPPYQAVHHAADRVGHSVKTFGAAAGWLIETGAAAVVGLVVGVVAVALVALLSWVRRSLSGLANRAGTDKM